MPNAPPPPRGWNTPAPEGSIQTCLFGPRSLVKVKVCRAERKLCFHFWAKPLPWEGSWLWISKDCQMHLVLVSQDSRAGTLKSGLVCFLGWFDFRLLGCEFYYLQPGLEQLRGRGRRAPAPQWPNTLTTKSSLSVRNEMCAHKVTFNCVLETHVRSTCGFTYWAEVITFQAVLC